MFPGLTILGNFSMAAFIKAAPERLLNPGRPEHPKPVVTFWQQRLQLSFSFNLQPVLFFFKLKKRILCNILHFFRKKTPK